MKKRISCILALVFILTLTGCSGHQDSGQSTVSTSEETNDVSDFITVEEDEHFLILPISKSKVSVWDEHTQYLDDIDLDLLKSAEEKLSGEISRYSNNSGFYLQLDEGYLCLAAEVIVQVQTDPSVSADNDEAGCIDHEHKFFSERITK